MSPRSCSAWMLSQARGIAIDYQRGVVYFRIRDSLRLDTRIN